MGVYLAKECVCSSPKGMWCWKVAEVIEEVTAH